MRKPYNKRKIILWLGLFSNTMSTLSEQILYKSRRHFKADLADYLKFLPILVVALVWRMQIASTGLFGLPMWAMVVIVLGFFLFDLFVISIIRRTISSYQITKSGVAARWNLFRSGQLPMREITAVKVKQDFIDRWLNVGKVIFLKDGKPIARFVGVRDPLYVEKLANSAIDLGQQEYYEFIKGERTNRFSSSERVESEPSMWGL
jgi:hypothetical protein